MSDVPENFDWVDHCAECTTQKMFEKLFDVVKSDVAAAKGKIKHTVEFGGNDRSFAVRRIHPMGVKFDRDETSFILMDKQIVVKEAEGQDLLSARATSEGTNCLLQVIGGGPTKPLRLWEFSQLVLEPMFFGD